MKQSKRQTRRRRSYEWRLTTCFARVLSSVMRIRRVRNGVEESLYRLSFILRALLEVWVAYSGGYRSLPLSFRSRSFLGLLRASSIEMLYITCEWVQDKDARKVRGIAWYLCALQQSLRPDKMYMYFTLTHQNPFYATCLWISLALILHPIWACISFLLSISH